MQFCIKMMMVEYIVYLNWSFDEVREKFQTFLVLICI